MALARELDCDVGYLLGDHDSPYLSDKLDLRSDGSVTGTTKLFREDDLSLEWMPLDLTEAPSEPPTPPGTKRDFSKELNHARRTSLLGDPEHGGDIYSLPAYPPGMQALHRVGDESFNLWFPVGTWLHVLYIEAKAEIQDRDIVIVHRQRLGGGAGGQEQISVRLARVFGDEIVLETATNNATLHEELRYRRDDVETGRIVWDAETPHFVGVRALVLRSIVRLAGPEINPPRAE